MAQSGNFIDDTYDWIFTGWGDALQSYLHPINSTEAFLNGQAGTHFAVSPNDPGALTNVPFIPDGKGGYVSPADTTVAQVAASNGLFPSKSTLILIAVIGLIILLLLGKLEAI